MPPLTFAFFGSEKKRCQRSMHSKPVIHVFNLKVRRMSQCKLSVKINEFTRVVSEMLKENHPLV